MPLFSEETLESVRAIPLYEIVRPQVDLSRSGKNWRGLSPFTNEKTPSFFVLTDKNYFKCHSSGLAGDGIKFIQETERLNFPEAVEALAERFGIPVRYASGSGPNPELRSRRQKMIEIHDHARDYYHQAFLAKNKMAAQVRSYWTEERGFSLDLARKFQVGFAPPESKQLLERLLKKGFPADLLAECGLFHTGRRKEDTASWLPVFRGRLMIPIRNLQGQVVAFTARQLEQTPRDHGSWKAKYINSPETPIFKKGGLLFNLDLAKDVAKESRRLFLVEGQLDALRCWDCGLMEAIAPQGTSMTNDQASLIKRYTDHLDVLLDPDEAGTKAVLRLLPIAYRNRLEVRVIRLPEGKDPDDFLRFGGMESLASLPAESGIEFAGRYFLGRGDPTPEKRATALNKIFEILSECPSAVVREGYFEEAIGITGVSRAAAFQDLRAYLQSSAPKENRGSVGTPKKLGTNPTEKLTNLEGDLFWAVLQNPEWAELLAQVIDQQWIRSQTCEGRILSLILAQATVDHIEGSDDIHSLLETDEERDCFSQYMVDDRPDSNLEDFVNLTIAGLIRRFCKERIETLNQEIAKKSQALDNLREVRTLMKEKQELIQFLRNGEYPTLLLTN